AGVANAYTYVGQLGVTGGGIGLLRMGYRNYDAVLGRFISQDPLGLLGGDANLRRYVTNNPVSGIDPQGLQYGLDDIMSYAEKYKDILDPSTQDQIRDALFDPSLDRAEKADRIADLLDKDSGFHDFLGRKRHGELAFQLIRKYLKG